jgi:hypothetical protein
MAEDQARAALHPFVAVGEQEAWIADQRWEAILGGWRFRVEQAPDAAGAGNLARACRAEAAGGAGDAAAPLTLKGTATALCGLLRGRAAR